MDTQKLTIGHSPALSGFFAKRNQETRLQVAFVICEPDRTIPVGLVPFCRMVQPNTGKGRPQPYTPVRVRQRSRYEWARKRSAKGCVPVTEPLRATESARYPRELLISCDGAGTRHRFHCPSSDETEPWHGEGR